MGPVHPPRPFPDAQTEELRALLTRRRQLIAMRTAEQNRLTTAPRRLQADIEAHIAWLDQMTDEKLYAILSAPQLEAFRLWRETRFGSPEGILR